MKTILTILVTAFFLFVSVPAFSIQGFSDTKPANFVKSNGKTQVNYNIHQISTTDMDGKIHKSWAYDYVEIKGLVTKTKFEEALKQEALNKKDKTKWTPSSLLSLEELKTTKLAQLETTFQEKAKEPIPDTSNNCSWSGGSESAMLIDGAIRLAQQKAAATNSTGTVTVNLYDSASEMHTLSIADAQKVDALVANAFQTLYAKKAAIAKAIKNATTIDDVNNISITL